jgi:hypothetical protein
MLLEALQSGEGVRNSAQVALAHRHQIEHFAVFGHLPRQRFSNAQGVGELAALDEPSGSLDFQLYR